MAREGRRRKEKSEGTSMAILLQLEEENKKEKEEEEGVAWREGRKRPTKKKKMREVMNDDGVSRFGEKGKERKNE